MGKGDFRNTPAPRRERCWTKVGTARLHPGPGRDSSAEELHRSGPESTGWTQRQRTTKHTADASQRGTTGSQTDYLRISQLQVRSWQPPSRFLGIAQATGRSGCWSQRHSSAANFFFLFKGQLILKVPEQES